EELPCNELRFITGAKHQIPTKAATELNQMIEEFARTHSKAPKEVLKS
ncbi:alpha/beta hydrolase, partial [Bacillus cereus]|nr:alpha/beta hydrolase [Bacillus cereus]